MHSVCTEKMVSSYDQTFVDQTKEIEGDFGQLQDASLISEWATLKWLSITKGRFDT